MRFDSILGIFVCLFTIAVIAVVVIYTVKNIPKLLILKRELKTVKRVSALPDALTVEGEIVSIRSEPGDALGYTIHRNDRLYGGATLLLRRPHFPEPRKFKSGSKIQHSMRQRQPRDLYRCGRLQYNSTTKALFQTSKSTRSVPYFLLCSVYNTFGLFVREDRT